MGTTDGGDAAAGLRVVIVDDDEWVRRGRAQALGERSEIGSVLSVDHQTALDWAPEAWDGLDVAVVDAHDPSQTWDRFIGVAVVKAIRARRSRDELRIVIITGHHRNDRLRIRAAEAGADWFFAHDEVRTVDALVEAICRPSGVPLDQPVRPSGLDDALDAVQAHGVTDVFSGMVPQKQAASTRRRIITLRSRLSKLLGLPGTASVREISEVINEARGSVERPPE